MGWIANKVKNECNCEVIFDLHVVAQKEVSLIDKRMLQYALSKPHSFIVHSLKTFEELKKIFPKQNYIVVSGERKSSADELKSLINNKQQQVVVVNRYVGNEEVPKYFQVADCNVLFYLVATPSGVESIAYNFKLPTLATRVGHFPETIKHGYNGYLAEPDNIDSMYNVMKEFLNNPIPTERVAEQAAHMSWENYAKAILNI